MQNYSKWQCCGIGALVGLAYVALDVTFGWSGLRFYPWQGQAVADNLGILIGSVLPFAIFGLIVGVIRDRRARRTGIY